MRICCVCGCRSYIRCTCVLCSSSIPSSFFLYLFLLLLRSLCFPFAMTAVASQSAFQKFLNSPAGPKTIHFWAPAMKWVKKRDYSIHLMSGWADTLFLRLLLLQVLATLNDRLKTWAWHKTFVSTHHTLAILSYTCQTKLLTIHQLSLPRVWFGLVIPWWSYPRIGL